MRFLGPDLLTKSLIDDRSFALPEGSYLRHTLPLYAPAEEDERWPVDSVLHSGDGCAFGVCSDVLKTGSHQFRQLFLEASYAGLPIQENAAAVGGIAAPAPGAVPPLKCIRVPEGGEVTLALIHATYPHTFPPIDDLALAEKAVAAAQKYDIEPFKLKFGPNMFDPSKIVQDPLHYCVFAWRMDLKAELRSSSRYTLHLDLARPRQYQAALEMPEGVNVFAALLATQIIRSSILDSVLDRLPRDLMCPGCREAGRTGLDEMKEVIGEIFEAPYPDLHTISNNVLWAESVLAMNCRADTCEGWIRQFQFSEDCKEELAMSMIRVPQEVDLEYLERYHEHLRGWNH